MFYGRCEIEGLVVPVRFSEAVPPAGDVEVTPLDGPAHSGGKPSASPRRVPVDAVRAPLRPGKIVCVGQNYRKHAAELGKAVPVEPLLFLKSPSSVIGPGEPILLPPESERVDHEGELGVVIGKAMTDVPEDEALAYVFGYTAANDVTARDLQRRDVQFTRAKSFNSFCPLGPFMRTTLTHDDVGIQVHVGETLRQEGHTSDMVFGVPRLLAYISAVMTLEPGDLILTGTPSGVGPVLDGDVVRVRLSGLGELRNPVATRVRGSAIFGP